MTETSANLKEVSIQVKPLQPIHRFLMILGGSIALVVGFVGIVIPILPSTPFFLIAATCYFRSSERLYRWVMRNQRISPAIRKFRETGALTLQVKVFTLLIAWTMLILAAVFVAESAFLRAFLIGLGILKTIVMTQIKTAD